MQLFTASVIDGPDSTQGGNPCPVYGRSSGQDITKLPLFFFFLVNDVEKRPRQPMQRPNKGGKEKAKG